METTKGYSDGIKPVKIKENTLYRGGTLYSLFEDEWLALVEILSLFKATSGA